jgi:hypothetical protein
MATYCNNQAHADNGQTAEDECQSTRRVRKQRQRSDRQKESGGHHQQSGVLHIHVPFGSLTGSLRAAFDGTVSTELFTRRQADESRVLRSCCERLLRPYEF